ncbi:MFS transporter [Caldovatus sediminis]|uniref:MFS transporter n=1 Tax=Caldovatus sediminis TaxID=2041189 RepID=A0A8J3EDS8_9PROT|nr:MFS transporter [Caldovatus sediminis]GGG45530.1 MFS transporter [Caldovatus sediminis]
MRRGRPPSPAASVALVGLAVAVIGASTTLPMPLFPLYAARDGQGAAMLALAFVCYAGALILTAPLLGGLSERIGRKPCVLAAVVFAGLATLALTVAPGLAALAVARVLQGLAIGLVAGAATAWAAELAAGAEGAARRAASVVTTGTAGSFAAGGLLTLGALAWLGETEPPITYLLHLLAATGLVVLVAWRVPETRHCAGGARVPWLRLPGFPAGTLPTTLAILPAWGVTGTTLTSVPMALAERGMPRLGPLAVCVMIAVGVAAQRALGRMAPRRSVVAGLGVLVAGTALVVLGTLSGALAPLLLGGAAVGSAAYGFLYLGGLAAVAQAAPAAERANAAAGYFLVAHLGFGLPPLLVGFAVERLGAAPALAGLWAAVAATALALARAIRRGAALD